MIEQPMKANDRTKIPGMMAPATLMKIHSIIQTITILILITIDGVDHWYQQYRTIPI